MRTDTLTLHNKGHNMTLKTLVFAGSAIEAEHWARANQVPRGNYLYVANANILRGRATHKNPRIHLDGFYRRRDTEDINAALYFSDLH